MSGRRRWLSRLLWAVLVAPVVVCLLAPSLVIIPMSFSRSPVLSFPPSGFTLDWYQRLFTSSEWIASARNSATVAFAATVLSLLLGVPAGLALGLRDWRSKRLMMAFVITPMVIPTVVLAIGMYAVYARLGLVGMWGLAAAHAVIAVPFVVITTMAAARQLDPTLLLAARSLGALPWQVFLNVTLPSIARGVLSGAVFAFVTSWDEVVIALFLTDPTFKTLPVQMWNQLSQGVDPTVAALATTLLGLTTLLMVSVLATSRRPR
ncbi:MAG: binding--dependent transport system inner rane component family protein [Frankiales bacterium]|jgi:putative spermidine/putrescine transport system permease protein|nr:binding--dependent transport system inner rane component family protein [Frankiales bacterium]